MAFSPDLHRSPPQPSGSFSNVFLSQYPSRTSADNKTGHDPDERIPKGHHLSVVFYATSRDRRKLEGIREFLTTSVLSTYYDFHCYEVSTDFCPETLLTSDKRTENVIMLTNVAGQKKTYGIHASNVADVSSYMDEVSMGLRQTITCEIASDGDAA